MGELYEPISHSDLTLAGEEELLAQLAHARSAGDAEQMRAVICVFVQGRYGQLMAMARLKLPAEQDAEDVVGDAIISALDSLEPDRAGFEGAAPGELAAWLFTILKRRIADYFRREARQIKAGSLDLEPGDEQENGFRRAPEPRALTADPVAEVAFHDAHERVLDQLSPLHRRVVELWWRERIPASEIVARLRQAPPAGVETALSVDNVHQIISRYRAEMRQALEVGD